MRHFILTGCILSFLGACSIPPLPTTTTHRPSHVDGYTPISGIPVTNLPTHSPNQINGAPNQVDVRSQAFPYDLKFDTLAHMNCPGDTHPGDPIFFSYKMAAYSSKGGLRLTDAFLKDTKNLNVHQKQRVLNQSIFYKSRARLALSERGNPAVPLNLGRGNVAFQTMHTFGHAHVTKPLIENNVVYSLANGAPLEVQVPLPGSVLYQFASLLGGSHILTLTYDNGANTLPVAKGNQLYYGKSYTLNFKGGVNSKDFLSRVTETDLITNKKEGRWACAQQMKFAVYRHPQITQYLFDNNTQLFKDFRNKNSNEFKDLNELKEDYCVEGARSLTQANRQTLQALFPSQSFIIGYSKKTRKPCIQPVDWRQDCYAGKRAARIEFGKGCSDLDEFKKCPAYLSVCLRK